jgi:hypothetical protein
VLEVLQTQNNNLVAFFNARQMQIKTAHFWKCTSMEYQEALAFLALFLLAISASEQSMVKNVPIFLNFSNYFN